MFTGSTPGNFYFIMGLANSKKAARVQDATVRDEVDLAVKEALKDCGGIDLETKVQVSVSVDGLKSAESYAVVGYVKEGQDEWKCIGSTETSSGSSTSSFVRTLVTDYTFETPQRIRLDLYRMDNGRELRISTPEIHPKIPDYAQYVGSLDSFVAEVFSSVGNHLTKPIGKTGCRMTVFVDELKILQNLVSFDIGASPMFVGISKRKPKARNIYLSIFRTLDLLDRDDPSVTEKSPMPQVVKTESTTVLPTQQGHLEGMSWKSIRVSVNSLCRGESDRPIVFELWEQIKKSDVRIGTCSVTYRQIEDAFKSNSPLEVAIGTGRLTLSSISVERRETFLDYVSNGLEVSLYIGIDFTKSNKDPDVPTSLHYVGEGSEDSNDYIRVIHSVVEILEHYDSDKKFPVYGFGARLPPSYTHCSHCFACNGDFFSPEVVGVEGVVGAYKQALGSVALHGPTNFHEIIRLVADNAQPYSNPIPGHQLRYAILLILTDGVITDMKQTINEIVRAADFPMSIIIVGVGNEDFGLMRMLDADDKKLYSTDERRFAQRDIVQFVPFNKFRNSPIHALARETLEEIPREVVDYFKARNVPPSVNRDASTDEHTTALERAKDNFVSMVSNMKGFDEFEIHRIINEDRLPAADCSYFVDVAKHASRGVNVLTQPRPVSASGADPLNLSHRIRRTVREAATTLANPESGNFTPNPIHRDSASSAVNQEPTWGLDFDSQGPASVCKICFDRPVETVLLPCGHSLLCQHCAGTVGRTCPMCRVKIQQVVRTYAA